MLICPYKYIFSAVPIPIKWTNVKHAEHVVLMASFPEENWQSKYTFCIPFNLLFFPLFGFFLNIWRDLSDQNKQITHYKAVMLPWKPLPEAFQGTSKRPASPIEHDRYVETEFSRFCYIYASFWSLDPSVSRPAGTMKKQHHKEAESASN